MLYVLVESNTAAILLLKLLLQEQAAGSVEVWASRPMSSLYARARTLLTVRSEPVALVLDADSTDPEAARRRRLAAEEVVGEAAGEVPLRVLIAEPALEALLFLRPAAISRAFGPTPPDLPTLGRVSPRDALRKLDPSGSEHNASYQVTVALDDTDVMALRGEPPVRELLEFLDELRRSGVVAAGAAGP
jgi:hypothetical protein